MHGSPRLWVKEGRRSERMRCQQWRKPSKVADVVSQQVLQSIRKNRRGDIGIMHLPAFDRKPLDQFAKLFGDNSGAFQNVET